MNATVILEHRFLRTPEGAVWTITAFPYAFWTRYLAVFEQVRIVARVRDVAHTPPDAKRVDGPRIIFHGVPYYHGSWQFARRYPCIRKALAAAIANDDAVIMRVPSFLSMVLEPMLHKAGRPYSLEVVGDPYDVFAPGAVRHPLRPFIRQWVTKALRNQCMRAVGVAYVTQHALQRRYPSPSMTGVSDVELCQASFSTHYSSIELKPGQLLGTSRKLPGQGPKATLVFVGTLEQLYKAPDVLLKAVALCVRAGFDLTLKIVGDGHYRGMLESMAASLGIADRCHFLGQLSGGTAVQDVLDSADLFVLPSRTEGLPRAMIEAMARSLPCIGSNAGGIPELLPEQDMVAPDDVEGLARKIQEFVSDRDRMISASARNVVAATEYLDANLQKRRTEFFTYTKAVTARWLSHIGRRGKAAA